jgi:tetratricopeptide (TPR) repeat protein
MRQLCQLGLLAAALISLWTTACAKRSAPQVEPPPETPAPAVVNVPAPPPPVPTAVAPAPAPTVVADQPLNVPPPPIEASTQEKYDAALLEALNFMAEKKYAEALVSLGTARALQNSEQVQREIDKIKSLLDQRSAADQTAQDIKTVINEGKPEEAAKLATAGLQQYGSTDEAEKLATLKRQADALAAPPAEDTPARQARFRREAEQALADKNLRAAAVAYEQALQCGDDPALHQQYDDLRATLARYDDNRKRAAELRRDPANLEDAITALQEAANAWDTLEVRQEIDLYTLALQKRRDRISVADFEVRGDVGIPAAGRTLAEELLPAFKRRFDLVERGQLSKVIEELHLEASELAENESDRREVGRLAKVRYLVLGSVTPLGGIVANARLVDVRSGLVVQTAKVVARGPEELLRLLPQLANQLMLTDEQKFAYEQRVATQTPVVVQPVVVAPLPPPPEPVIAGQPVPPPVIVFNPRPPDFGGVRVEDFDRLPLLPPAGQPALATQLVIEQETPVKQRLLQVAVDLGDNLFRRGRYREAHTQFELALNLSPGHFDLRVRLDRCKALLPPPPPPAVVVVTPPVVVAPRPRIAGLNFVVNAQPGVVPVGLGDWAADQMASYFAPTYEVVDRGQLFWYMGRLGLTVRDVAVDASARLWLGRAMNVRYFAFGVVQQTASFNVATHVVDAESGVRQGVGRVHVQDPQELKLRMAELARQTQTNPRQLAQLQRQTQENERQVNEVRRLLKNGQAAQAAALSQTALKQDPNNVALQALLSQAQQQAQAAALEEARRREAQQRQARALALQQQQAALIRQAEAARRQAQQEAAARSDAARRAQELQRRRAYDQLLALGRQAVQQRNYALAVEDFQSAVALNPTAAAGVRELAQAKTLAEQSTRARAADEQARRESDQRRQREAELARVRAQVEDQRRRREADEQARRKAQEARDQAAYAKLVDDGKRLLVQGKYDAAAATLQTARQMRKTEEVDRLIAQAAQQQAKAAADKQSAQARAELGRRQAEEKMNRDRAEAQAKRTRDQYTQALQQAQQAMAAKRYDQAVVKFQEADGLFHTDVALTGLRQAKDALAKEKAAADQARQKQAALEEQKRMAAKPSPKPQGDDAQKKRLEQYQTAMQAGGKALYADRYDDAVKAFSDALRAQPGDAQAANLLAEAQKAQAEQKRKQQAAQAKPPAPRPAMQPPPKPVQPAVNVQAAYSRQMQAAAAFEKQQKYDDAITAYKEALRLVPGDNKADAALHMATGQKLMKARKFADAAREFETVLKLSPGHAEAAKALKQAKQGR